jgi:hypothetical protein
LTGWALVIYNFLDLTYVERRREIHIEFNFLPDGTVPIDLFVDNAPPSIWWAIDRSLIHQMSWEIYVRSITLKPCYMDLLSGYSKDDRLVPSYPVISPAQSKVVKISYYRENKLEGIPDLRSICWMVYKCELVQDEVYILPIKDCVLGTLYIDDDSFADEVKLLPTDTDSYPWQYLFPSDLHDLFNQWESLWLATTTGGITTEERILHKLAANNDIWHNGNLTMNLDIGFISNHPMFQVNHQRAYDWYIKPQLNTTALGDLIMIDPMTMEIHRALDAGKWGVNPDDPTIPRMINLGWLIEKIGYLLGCRLKPNGDVNTTQDKKLIAEVIDSNKKIDPKKVGINTFGLDGMLVRRITNRFKKDKIVSDQCVILQDIPQIIQEYFEQSNIALGIQESSAVEIKQQDGTARFNNQLEMLVELVNLMSSGNEMIRAGLVSSLVSQSQSNEIIAGLGLPCVTKTIPIKIDKQVLHLPYKGISAHRSISQEIATCTYNVGIATGQLL